MARRTEAWFDATTPDERGPIVGAVVLLGLGTALLMPFTILVFVVVIIRTLSGRRGWLLQRLLVAAAVGLEAVLQIARWAVLRRLHEALADFENRSAL